MQNSPGLDTAVERSAMTKASWRILPLLGLGYLVAYVDRANISFAATQMNADLHFNATVYGLGAGMFFLSYALFEVPSNLLLVRFGARRWIARVESIQGPWTPNPGSDRPLDSLAPRPRQSGPVRLLTITDSPPLFVGLFWTRPGWRDGRDHVAR